MSEEEIIWEVKRDSINKLVQSGKRIDGRAFDEQRPITITNNFIENAEGSTLVKIGNTAVLAGIKMDVMEPFPDTPEEGVLMTNAELVPMADPTYYAGPPTEDSIEFARVVDRGVRESKMIDVSKLCISPGEKVWAVMIDMHVLDYDGNLFDAGSLAAVNALWNARIPRYEEDKIVRGEWEDYLPLNDKPISNTFVKIAGKNLLDPLIDEERVMDARITMAVTEKDALCAAQKSGTGFYTKQDLDEMLDLSIAKSKQTRKLIKRE
ncbi:MAG: exosome complex protein Rrp42 [archaeon]